MPWATFETDLRRHRKLERIPEKHRAKALGIYVAMILYSVESLTDGNVTRAIASEICHELGLLRYSSVLRSLVEAGLLRETKRSFIVHDFADFQLTRAEVEERRKHDRERKREQRRQTQFRMDVRPDIRKDSAVDVREDLARARATPLPSYSSSQEPKPQLVAPADEYLDRADPVNRLLLVLPDRHQGTEKRIRELAKQVPSPLTPEQALDYARDEVQRTGGRSGRAVRILERVVREGRLVTPLEERTA